MPPAVEISLLKKNDIRQQVQPQDGRFDTGADRLFGWLNGYIKPSINLPYVDIINQQTPHIDTDYVQSKTVPYIGEALRVSYSSSNVSLHY